jgi:flagellin-like hook-associated protein FlgL
MIVTRQELATILGIPSAKVGTLVQNNVFASVTRGKYDLTDCIQKFVEYSVEQLLKKYTSDKAESARAEENLQYWKMVRQKTAALKELGVTMRLEDAERLMSVRLEQIRNVLNTIDSVWSPYMVGLKTVEESQKMLSKQLDNLFEQLSTLQDFDIEDELPDTETEEEDDDDNTE